MNRKIERPISRWNKLTAAVTRLPEIGHSVKEFRNWAAITRVYAGGPMPEDFAAHGRAGFTLPLRDPTDVVTAWVVFCTGGYYLPVNSDTVLDLGANIGAFSLFATKCRNARRVYALEPVAGTFDTLQDNLRTNGLANVSAIRKGIGRETGKRTIYLGVTSQHASIIYRGMPRYESGLTEEVEIVTLDDLFEELNLEEVDMAKMDCEGGEVEAILAASDECLRRIKHLSLEYHFQSNISNETEFFGRLDQAGFKCTKMSRAGKLAQFVRI
jgi:FkbM family methyltransferase